MLKKTLVALLSIVILSSSLHGQTGEVEEFADRFDKMYLGQQPVIGSTIEHIPGLDEDGNPFDMARIKGKYTVVVFGCLT